MSDRPRDRQKGMDTLFPLRDGHSCRVCNEHVEDGRRNYCCPRCKRIAQAVQRMFVWDCVREAVLERDDYTCRECGLSKDQWARAYRQVRERIDELAAPAHPQRADHPAASYDRWRRVQREFEARYDVDSPYSGGFHVDHIERVADGGHPFDETNLQTLCKFCHRTKTGAENQTGEPTIDERPEVGLDAYMDDAATDGGEEDR